MSFEVKNYDTTGAAFIEAFVSKLKYKYKISLSSCVGYKFNREYQIGNTTIREPCVTQPLTSTTRGEILMY